MQCDVCGGIIYISNKSKYLKTEMRYATAEKINLYNFYNNLLNKRVSFKQNSSLRIPFKVFFLQEAKSSKMFSCQNIWPVRKNAHCPRPAPCRRAIRFFPDLSASNQRAPWPENKLSNIISVLTNNNSNYHEDNNNKNDPHLKQRKYHVIFKSRITYFRWKAFKTLEIEPFGVPLKISLC